LIHNRTKKSKGKIYLRFALNFTGVADLIQIAQATAAARFDYI
jgi:hypothetical protein